MILRRSFLRMAFVALASGMLGTELVERTSRLCESSMSPTFTLSVDFMGSPIHDSVRITDMGPGWVDLVGQKGVQYSLTGSGIPELFTNQMWQGGQVG